jgi:hypothetical protein
MKPLLVAIALLALVLGVARSGAAQDGKRADESLYQFTEADISLIGAKISESLLTASFGDRVKPKVAWLRLRNDTDDRKLPVRALLESLEVELIKSGRLSVLRREDLEKVAQEQGLTNAIFSDQSEVMKLGTFAAVECWWSGTLTARVSREDGKEFTYYNFTSFITDAKTGEKLWGESAEIKKARKLQLVERRLK